MVAPDIGTEEVMPDECLVSKKGGKDKPEDLNVFMGPGGWCSAGDERPSTLNRINPDYRAEIIYLSLDRSEANYLCGFFLGEKLFIMDYGNLYENMIGTHGPFKNLDHYIHLFYFRRHPHQKKPLVYHFGFPSAPSSKAR